MDTLQLFLGALETMQLGVTVTDTDGVIVYTNPADAAMHGYGVDELIGRDVGIFSPSGARQPLSPDELSKVRSWKRVSMNIRKDGTTFPVQLLSDVVRNPTGKPIGIVTTCEDITTRKQAESALRRSHDELDQRVLERTVELSDAVDRLQREIAERERAEQERQALEAQLRQAQKLEAVGQLTGGIAHDFNNILSAILANAEYVSAKLGDSAGETGAAVGDIVQAAHSGASLIGRLLGFSRQAELTLVPLDLSQTITGLSEMLRRLIPANIDVHTELASGLPQIRADRGAIQQIVMNLATNARDAMPNGGALTLRVALTELDQANAGLQPPGRYVCLAIRDNGTGMDEQTRQRIFEPFFTTKPPGKGTGLGMSMIYGLITQHRGFVDVQSELGTGTTVTLYIPELDTSEATISPTESAEDTPSGTETVLLVDDEPGVRAAGDRVLRSLGYTVILAENGAEALEAYHTHSREIDLILTDLVMPKMSGLALHQALLREGARVPFLFCSGHSSHDSEERRALSKDLPFLKKPWSTTQMAQAVRTVLDHPSSAP